MAQDRTPHPVAEPRPWRAVAVAFLLLIVFNVAVPKGGLMFGGVPVTFGYMLLAALSVPALFGLALVRPRGPALLQLGLGFLPLGIMTAFVVGTVSSSATQLAIYGTLFVTMPIIMLLALVPYLERLTEAEITWALVWSLRFAVAWGLINFFLYAAFHQFLRIPYITVNAADLDAIFDRNNRRGSLMKLVSSYNNGNVFGVVAIMLCPLYLLRERVAAWRGAFLLSIVLTLSRTAWLGLIAVFGISAALGLIRLTRPAVWLMIGLGIACIATLLPFMNWSSNSLVDSDLGGRLGQIEGLQITPFGIGQVRIAEIVYAGMLQSFGVIGSIFAVVAFATPVIFGFSFLSHLSAFRRAALAGCIAYLAVAMSDGALILAPVLPVFLFLCGLIYRRGFYRAAASALGQVLVPHRVSPRQIRSPVARYQHPTPPGLVTGPH